MADKINLAKRAKTSRKRADEIFDKSIVIKDAIDGHPIMCKKAKLNKAYKQCIIASTQTKDAHYLSEKDSPKREEYEKEIEHLEKTIKTIEKFKGEQ